MESGTNDPFAVFLTLMLVQYLSLGQASVGNIVFSFAREALLGTLIGIIGGRLIVYALNRVGLAQGLHAPFVTTGALVLFGMAQASHASGFLAVYIAGLVIGNQPTRAHNTVVVFLDAATWLAQIVMFVLLGLLVWPQRLFDSLWGALAVALVLMFVARPIAVFACLAPFRFPWREKLFVSWVGLRGAVGIFLASIPMLVGLPKAYLYFDVAFVVVIVSLSVQGWTLALAAKKLHVALRRAEQPPRRVELDLPGQMEQELVGYSVLENSLYLRRGLVPSWSRPTLVIRDEKILSPLEAAPIVPGDYIYLLAPPEKAAALDRFFVNMPPPAAPDPRLLGDFFLSGDAPLGALAELYGVPVAEGQENLSLADYFDLSLERAPHAGDALPLGEIELVAHRIGGARVSVVALRIADDEPPPPDASRKEKLKARWRLRLRQAADFLLMR